MLCLARCGCEGSALAAEGGRVFGAFPRPNASCLAVLWQKALARGGPIDVQHPVSLLLLSESSGMTPTCIYPTCGFLFPKPSNLWFPLIATKLSYCSLVLFGLKR